MKTHSDSNYEARLEEILAGYVLGNLDEAELTWLNQQLSAHPELQKQVKELNTTLNLLPYDLPEESPNNNLRGSILAQAEGKVSVKSKLTRFNRFAWIISGVTLLSTLCFGWQNYHLRQQLAQTNYKLKQQELKALLYQSNNRLVSFQGLDQLTPSSGSLFVSSDSQKAILALQNLPSLSGKQVYRLWAVSQGKKTGCANFTPNKEGKVYLELSNDVLNEANLVFITIEPKANTKQPLGTPILTGSYTDS
ncbi:MAG: anti-sigma factor [Microcystaceae cyanobacterium]